MQEHDRARMEFKLTDPDTPEQDAVSNLSEWLFSVRENLTKLL